MKKQWKAVIAVILSVWLFVMGFELGIYKERHTGSSAAIVTTSAVPSTTTTEAPPQSEESELFTFPDLTVPQDMEAPEDVLTSAQTETTAAVTEKSPAALSTAEILESVRAAMQTLKSEQTLQARKIEKTTITVTDCSLPAAVSLLNRTLAHVGVDETVTYMFSGGKAVGYDAAGKAVDGGKRVTPHDVLPPKAADFTLPIAGVKQASAAADGSNTVYTIRLVEETASLENMKPLYHAQAVGYLDLLSLDLPGVTITEANMIYSGAVMTVTVNKDGKITKLSVYLPMQGSGAGRLGPLSGTASIEGNDTVSWEFNY